jgi:signal transduction histidine kinase
MADEILSHINDRASALADALRERRLENVRAMCTDDLWARLGDEEYGGLLPHVVGAELLGTLFRRSVLRLETPGWKHASLVFEHLWDESSPALVEDQRMFTRADRAEVERSGDQERLARMRTKLDAQDAAERLAEALRAHDADAAMLLFDPELVHWRDHELRTPLTAITTAELIGSVGPRTLVRISGARDQTVEYLWRRAEGGMLVAGARVFRLG